MPNGDVWDKRKWNEVRKRAIHAMDHICGICGKQIDMDLPQYHPMSCTVDHIIPVARGGHPYEMNNLQLAHDRCNKQKGVKMREDYIDMTAKELCPLSNKW